MTIDLTNAAASPSPVQPGPVTTSLAPQAAASPTGDKPINVHELPEFRAAQAGYERRLREMQEQLTKLQTAGMDDFERLQFENQQLKQQVEQVAAERARREALEAIAQRAGIPVTAIESANDPDEAWSLALAAVRDGGGAAPAAPPVDVGGGSAVAPQVLSQRDRETLLRQGDTKGFFLSILEDS
ncbi:MAG: hypothetical protein U0X20_23780 [Caldilineaceae bacterium]